MNIKESIINGMIVFSSIYIFVCAFINLLGDIEHLNLVIVIGMIVVSSFDVLLLIVNLSKNYKKMVSSKKAVIFMCASLTIMWNVILLRSIVLL